MILILSSDGDVSTGEVIDWLNYYNVDFVRLNDNDIFNYPFSTYIEEGALKFVLEKGGRTICSDDVTMVWFRKFGFFAFSEQYPVLRATKNIKLIQQFTGEYFSILSLITSCLAGKKWLMDKKNCIMSKLDVLAEAEKAGLTIPRSQVLNSKEQLFTKLHDHPLITKTVKDASQITYNGKFLSMFTTEIQPVREAEENLPPFFMPSLVQEKIEKAFELRIFYIDGHFYSMAIFSQSDAQTQTDFRKYNFETPNRTIPYKLPLEVEEKLSVLMRRLKMNTGSIDMILTRNKEYIFLEVNPAGQFGMVSKPCNYPLERRIAEYLANN